MGVIEVTDTAVGNQAVCGAFLQSSRSCRFSFPSSIFFYKLQCFPVFSKHSFLRHVLHCQVGKHLGCCVLCPRLRASFLTGLRREQPCSEISSWPHLLAPHHLGFFFPSWRDAAGTGVAAASMDGPRLQHSRTGRSQGGGADTDLSAQHGTEWRGCQL